MCSAHLSRKTYARWLFQYRLLSDRNLSLIWINCLIFLIKKNKTFLILKLIPIYKNLFFSFWLSGDVQRDIDMLTQDFRLSYGKIYIDVRKGSLFVKLVHRKLCRLSWQVANFNECSFIQIDLFMVNNKLNRLSI